MKGLVPRRYCFLILFSLMFAGLSTSGKGRFTPVDKQDVQQIVQKHLESIGSAEARKSASGRIIMGTTVATMRIGGSGHAQGNAVMASSGEKSLIGLVFGSGDYSNEKAGYDGERLTLGEFRPGVRTNLGGFLLNHDILFREGLIGGTLSTAWALLDVAGRGPKLSYGGTKKIDGREAYVLKYEPKKGSNLTIRLYFDAENYHHIRSLYEQEYSPVMAARPQDAASQKVTRLQLQEDFSDFKPEGGLTLPHSYRIQLTFESTNQPLLQDWVVTLNRFAFNQKISDSQFDVTPSTAASTR